LSENSPLIMSRFEVKRSLIYISCSRISLLKTSKLSALAFSVDAILSTSSIAICCFENKECTSLTRWSNFSSTVAMYYFISAK